VKSKERVLIIEHINRC